MKIKLIAVLALLFVSSCATVNLEQMQSEIQGYSLPFKPKKDNAVVYVVRPSHLGTLIKFNVFLDDKESASEMGYTLGNQYVYFSVTPGHHKILSKAENWAEVEIEAQSGDVIFIKQNASMGFIMARNSLKILSDTEGKFYIKKATNGGIKKLEKISLAQ